MPALARQMNLSERHFTRVFKAELGITAADHVETVRLESACRLLETTGSSIEQIARTCGFGTPETMNRTFRRRLNTTPGEHRHHFKPGTLRPSGLTASLTEPCLGAVDSLHTDGAGATLTEPMQDG